MREILFRGKRIDNGEWVYGYYYKAKYYRSDTELCDFITVPYPEVPNKASDHIMVEPETVGQYTGLTDKNGKKIFEGDIVNYEDAVADFEGYHDDVFINSGEVIISPWGGVIFTNRKTVEMDDLFDSEICVDAVVCGNIYDNPELLKGGAKE